MIDVLETLFGSQKKEQLLGFATPEEEIESWIAENDRFQNHLSYARNELKLAAKLGLDSEKAEDIKRKLKRVEYHMNGVSSLEGVE